MQTEPTLRANMAIRRQARTGRVVGGTFLGRTWGASLRAWLAVIAGGSSNVIWRGTVMVLLLPATLVGAAAEHARRTGGRGAWRCATLAPLLFVVMPALVQNNFVTQLLRTGIGGGAIGIALIGIIDGYAISGRGPRWARAVSRAIMAALVVAAVVGAFVEPPTAAGAYTLLTFIVVSWLLAGACAIPHLPAQHQIAASNSRGQLARHSQGGIT